MKTKLPQPKNFKKNRLLPVPTAVPTQPIYPSFPHLLNQNRQKGHFDAKKQPIPTQKTNQKPYQSKPIENFIIFGTNAARLIKTKWPNFWLESGYLPQRPPTPPRLIPLIEGQSRGSRLYLSSLKREFKIINQNRSKTINRFFDYRIINLCR